MKTILRYIGGTFFALALIVGLKVAADYKIVCVKEKRTLGSAPSLDGALKNRYHTAFSTRTDASGSTARCYVKFDNKNNKDIVWMHPALAARMNLNLAPTLPSYDARSVYIIGDNSKYKKLIKFFEDYKNSNTPQKTVAEVLQVFPEDKIDLYDAYQLENIKKELPKLD